MSSRFREGDVLVCEAGSKEETLLVREGKGEIYFLVLRELSGFVTGKKLGLFLNQI